MTLDDRIRAKAKAVRVLEDYAEAGTTEYARQIKARSMAGKVRAQLEALMAKRAALRQALRSAMSEQSIAPCDVPWCIHAADHEWRRTPAEIKASGVKYKGTWRYAEPVSVRCPIHVPFWYADRYAEFVQGAAVAA